jgi:alkylation response protein AidB-like acyl-CoA dehydrogenase
MDLTFTAEQEAFRLRLRRWLEQNLPPGWGTDDYPPFASYEEEVAFMREWQNRLYRAGWVGLSWPREYGGQGATLVEQAIYNQEMARVRAPELVNKVGVNNVGPTLFMYGTEEQKQRFLAKILSAEELWCQLFSEPGAGSDLASLRTRAEPDGDGYRLSGQKVWTSYAQFSRWAICLARTDPDAPKHRGLSYLIVDMQVPGIEIRPLRQMTGSSEFNEVFLDNAFVPRANLIGPENEGWAVAMHTLAHERGTSFCFKEQVKQKIWMEQLIDAIRQRAATGQAVPALVRDEAIKAYINVEIMGLMNLKTITRLERGELPGPESSLVKEYWTRLSQHLQQTAMAALDVHGQLMTGDPRAIACGRWGHSYLYAQSNGIAGGTSEVQLNIVAQRMLGLPKG